MSWAKIDDLYQHHPKVAAAGPAAELLQIRAICYCCRYRTGGCLPLAVIPSLLVGFETIGASKTVEEWVHYMCAHRLWDAASTAGDKVVQPGQPGGYVLVHDFANYNPAASPASSPHLGRIAGGRNRAAGAERNESGRFVAGRAARSSHRTPAGQQHADKLDPGSSPVPVPVQKSSGSSTQAPIGAPSVSTAPLLKATDKDSRPDCHPQRAVIKHFAKGFQAVTGRAMTIAWARDTARIKPAIDAHGVDGTIALVDRFFASQDGWWVEQRQWGIGEFMAAVNALAGRDAPVPAGQRLSPAMRRNVANAQAALERLEQEERGA